MALSSRQAEQRAVTRHQKKASDRWSHAQYLLNVLCALILLAGCGSVGQNDKLLALVDGDRVTDADLRYSLTIKHRKQDLSSAKAIDLTQFVNKLIDDRLLVHEARRAGMDKLPEIQEAARAYILRESVVRLHRQEIVDPVIITQEEMRDYYVRNYERFRLGVIETKSEREAKDALSRLRNGCEQAEGVEMCPGALSTGKSGEIVARRLGMAERISGAVASLKPGEYSDVIEQSGTYYVIKLIDRAAPPENEFDKARAEIERRIRKNKEREKSDEYLKKLRAGTQVTTDMDLLAEIKRYLLNKETQRPSGDNRPLVKVGGETLTAGEFVSTMSRNTRRSVDDEINGWIERKLIDQEALSRHYEEKPDLKELLRRYENELLRQAYINRVVRPQIKMTDDEIKEYYRVHQKDYMKPAVYKVQVITSANNAVARELERSLENGAEFSWAARRISESPERGSTMTKWTTGDDLPIQVREIICAMKVGEISPMIDTGNSKWMVLRLQDKREEQVEEFDKVREAVGQACFNEQTGLLLQQYLRRLKEGIEIKIFSSEILSMETQLRE